MLHFTRPSIIYYHLHLHCVDLQPSAFFHPSMARFLLLSLLPQKLRIINKWKQAWC
jgi:hypothetical protein